MAAVPVVLAVDLDRVKNNGRQADARTASGPTSSFWRTLILPVRTFVADRNGLTEQ